jgi:hypothetical protein
MKILAVSDQVVDRMYELVPQGHFSGATMVLACGDLPYEYLEYLVTLMNVPVFYVPGNHDPAYRADVSEAHAAGCTNLDLRSACYKEVLLAGFGGIRHRPGGESAHAGGGPRLRLAPVCCAIAVDTAGLMSSSPIHPSACTTTIQCYRGRRPPIGCQMAAPGLHLHDTAFMRRTPPAPPDDSTADEREPHVGGSPCRMNSREGQRGFSRARLKSF